MRIKIPNLLPEYQLGVLPSNDAVLEFLRAHPGISEMVEPDLKTWTPLMSPQEIRWAGYFAMPEDSAQMVSFKLGILRFAGEYFLRALYLEHPVADEDRVHAAMTEMIQSYMSAFAEERIKETQS
jgi:hypothetical protein